MTKSASRTVARRLLKARTEAGLSLRAASAASGVSFAQISGIENGSQDNPTLKTLLQLCAVYNTSLSELLRGIK